MYPKTCTGCGKSFETNNFRQGKCKRGCGRKQARTSTASNAARKRKAEAHELEFIGVDGEGITRLVEEWVEHYEEIQLDDGTWVVPDHPSMVLGLVPKHEYVLLSVGDKSLHHDGEALTHVDIFSFLWECYQENPDAAYVGFFLGYDFTQWFKSLPWYKGWSLLHKEGIKRRTPTGDVYPFPWAVSIDGWDIDILANKRFKLRPTVPRDKRTPKITVHEDGSTSTKYPHPYKWMYICDAGSYFQTSFLNTINPKGWTTPILSDDEYAIIKEGKEERATAKFSTDMIRYNLLENEVLARVMKQMNEGLVSDGIRLPKHKWFGPGQAAQEWLKLAGCPEGEVVREHVPQYARDAAKESYYGGWFEIFFHGPIPGKTYAYDINSAYPAIIANLPCLLHGKWTKGTGSPKKDSERSITLVKADLWGKSDIAGPAPHRSPDGTILRPRRTRGWHWQHELEASKRAGFLARRKVLEWVRYDPCDCPPPLSSIRELYEGRLQVGKNSPSGKAKKIVYNSSYGKLAQSIGQPRFSNPFYATLITAGCRTMILDAIATHPVGANHVAMVATDSVVFLSPHDAIDLDGQRLGAWDETIHDNLSLFMPGLYWDDKSRAAVAAGASPKVKSRGVAAGDLAAVINKIDDMWGKLDNVNVIDTNSDVWPVIHIDVNFAMVTAKSAAARSSRDNQSAWADCGRLQEGVKKTLSGTPKNKRALASWDDVTRPGTRLLRSQPYEAADLTETTPYAEGFGEVMTEMRELDDLVTPHGLVSDDVREVIPR